jgi:multicomponent Na+:H+ antiporter subunit F
MILIAAEISISIMIVAMVISLVRIIKGPSLLDKVVSLDLAITLSIGIILTFIFLTDIVILIDIVLITSLLFFLGTIIIAQYQLKKKTK